ncbi:MAG: flagellar filament capping protein FliD [Gammaproteobacteria bacterium]|nr:flagellar filament capping protein FliD [Gammaproteobacteria bacterium]
MLTSTGIGSGLDIDSIVTAIVDSERLPLMARVNARRAQVDTLVSGFGILQTQLESIRTNVASLADASKLKATQASTTDASAVTVEASSTAQPGSYIVNVSALASAHSLVSGTFAATTEVVGSGTLSIKVGTGSATQITVASNSTVAEVRDAINASNSGVTASILKDGASYRLMMSADTTGAANTISISVTNDGDSSNSDNAGLSQLAYNANETHLSQSLNAADAAFTLNGLSLTSSTNQITDIVDGVDVTLSSITTSSVSLSVTRDSSKITGFVESFVSAYNSYVGSSKSLIKYDATTGKAGSLQGDAMSRAMLSQVRGLITGTYSDVGGNYDALTDIGVTLQADGSLKIDSAKLDTAVRTDLDSLEKLFVGQTVSGTTYKGLATQLDELMDGFLDATGLLPEKLEALDARIVDIEKDRAVFDARMLALEERTLRKFNAMDLLLGEITSTGDMLKAQLDALPGFANLRQSGSR